MKKSINFSYLKSHDFKFLATASIKIIAISLTSITFFIYALSTLLEINFKYLLLNKLQNDHLSSFELTMNLLINHFNHDILLIMGIVISTLLMALITAHLAIRPFKQLVHITKKAILDHHFKLSIKGFKKKQAIYQSFSLFFTFMSMFRKNGKKPRIKIPLFLREITAPKTDSVFLAQYSFLSLVITSIWSFLFYHFAFKSYETLISLVKTNELATNYVHSQEPLFHRLIIALTLLQLFLYFLLSKNIVQKLNGVYYAFTRDIIKVVNGEVETRFTPRKNDPGKELAQAVNHYLTFIFTPEDEKIFFEFKGEEILKIKQMKQINHEYKLAEKALLLKQDFNENNTLVEEDLDTQEK